MDVVVYLAFAVLLAVFCISLAILIVMCRRRYEYNRLTLSESVRFSKLKRENTDNIHSLSPHISQTLSSNQWVFDISGVLKHCVAVLKLCHMLTDKLAGIPLQDLSAQVNEMICHSTARVVPRFDDLLKALAAPTVDVLLIEARVTALTAACWALVTPFYMMDPKYKELFGEVVSEMETHQQHLTTAVEQIEQGRALQTLPSTSKTANSSTITSNADVEQPAAAAVTDALLPNEAAPADPSVL